MSLTVIGGAAILLIVVAVTGDHEKARSIFRRSRLFFETSFLSCFLAGTTTVLLILLIVLKVLFTHRPFGVIGVLVLGGLFLVCAAGLVVSSTSIGQKVRTLLFFSGQSSALSTATGYISITSASLLPIFGWAATVALLLAGTGAVLRGLFSRSTEQ